MEKLLIDFSRASRVLVRDGWKRVGLQFDEAQREFERCSRAIAPPKKQQVPHRRFAPIRNDKTLGIAVKIGCADRHNRPVQNIFFLRSTSTLCHSEPV